MTYERQSANRLVVTHDDTAWPRWGLRAGLFFLGLAIYTYATPPRNSERLTGSLGAAACCLLLFLFAYERSVFEFDRGLKTVSWRRRLALREKTGTIPFASIKAVVAQRPIGDDGTPSRRVVLLTTEGDVPLARGYKPDSGECDIVAGLVREMIGFSGDDPIFEQAKTLAREGREMDAIRLLANERSLSLSDASERVKGFRNGG